MRPVTAAACFLSATGSALAQPGVATYSIAFGSATGPSSVVLEPGQSTQVFVNLSFTPGVGGGNPPVLGLSDGGFSISGQGSGAGMWSVNSNFQSPTFSLPPPWGGQFSTGLGTAPGTGSATGVSGVIWHYGFLFSGPHPYPQNPANIWHGTFTAGSAGIISTAFVSLGMTGVFAGTTGLPTVVLYASQGLGGQITIVPAPAALSALGLAGLLAARRRR